MGYQRLKNFLRWILFYEWGQKILKASKQRFSTLRSITSKKLSVELSRYNDIN